MIPDVLVSGLMESLDLVCFYHVTSISLQVPIPDSLADIEIYH